jgi:hypothetical protein
MSLHGSDNRHLGVSPVGSVMKTGYSLDLPLDTAGLFSKDKRKTKSNGLKAISDFGGVAKDELLTLMFGTKKDTGTLGSDKNERTVDFALRNVKKVGIAHPKNADQKFDYFRVGWDGVNDNTSFQFHTGQTLEFQMTVGGIAATFFNNADQYTVRTLINIPNAEAETICDELGEPCLPVDCREHTIAMVKNLNDYSLPGGDKLSQYFDIYPIFDTPTANATPVEYTQWCLEYCGFGGDHELSAVAAQYPGQEVRRDTMSNQFVIFAPATYTPENYVETKGAILKGCDDCPVGWTEIPAGFVYGVALEDDGVDLSATVQALPGAVAESAVKTGQDFGVGHYAVVLTAQLTEEQEETFATANPTAVLKFVGTKEAFCDNTESETHAWVACGSCEASTAKYRIMVPDDCNGSRLAEIQAAYPDLTVTQVLNQNCVSVFETTVETTLSCDEGCNPALVQQVFSSEAPVRFGLNNYWYPVEDAAVPGTTKCGFEIKGKPIVMNPGESMIDDLPFIMTSSRVISLSGGYPIDYSMNSIVPKGIWSVLQLERAQDLDNLGGNLREWEQKGRFYFLDEKPYRSEISRNLTGSQTRLHGLTQYSDVSVTIEKDNKAGINDKEYSYLTYHILVPFGRTTDLEEVFRSLAGAAGLDFEVK